MPKKWQPDGRQGGLDRVPPSLAVSPPRLLLSLFISDPYTLSLVRIPLEIPAVGTSETTLCHVCDTRGGNYATFVCEQQRQR